jgi:hypothetical protein
MLDLLERIRDAAALDYVGYLSSGTYGSTEDAFRLVASHKREHTEHMRAALAPAADGARTG